MTNDLLHQEIYTVRTYEIDLQKRITVPALVRLMQEAAMQQVLQLKISVWDLESKQLSWVIMGLQLKIRRLPQLNEMITIKTSPTGWERLITYRGFWVYDRAGNLLVSANSHWVLMDTNTRKLRPLPEWLRERFIHVIPNDEVEGMRASRQKIPSVNTVDYQTAFRVRWHDLDFNLHLNNTFYLLYLLEGLPDEFLAARQLAELHIIYKAEVRKETSFQIQVQQISPSEFIHHMVQDGDRPMLLAEMRTSWHQEY